ncbi:IWS1 homolog A-like protein [Tanacetum coccineum]
MDGFNDRVGKVFDCLSSSSSSNTKAWSLSDAQIERKPWNRDKTKSDIINDDETLVSSSFHNLFKSNNTDKCPDDDDDNDLDDEEDEYDKIAAGTENADGHLLYMKDVTNHAPFLNSHNILSSSSNDTAPLVKSILKRKSNELEKPSAKRVRFDPTCKEHDAPQVDGFHVAQVSKSVPDYLINPSNYTRYTFNDNDDRKSNTEAYLDFLEQIKKSKDVGSAELPASVVFIPRKKRGDGETSKSEGEVKETSNGVAAVAVQQDEVSDMIQDDPDVDDVCAKPKPPKFQKPSRRYRSKIEDDDSVC